MPRKRPEPAEDPTRRVVVAAMELAAERGWSGLSMAEIAERAGLPLGEMLERFPAKRHVLDGVGRIADLAMLEADAAMDAGEPARDRLFDRVMRRFDALLPLRPGLRRVVEELPRDPLPFLGSLPRLGRSMAWTLEAAGIPAGGLAGIARTKALSAVYLRAMRVWLDDDSADLARTMASLDAQLRRLEEFTSLLGRRRAASGGAGTDRGEEGDVPPA